MSASIEANYLAAVKLLEQHQTQQLEELIMNIARFGKPRLTMFDSGKWWCYVEMNVPTAGSSFKIESESKHPTPMGAARELAERMLVVLRQWPSPTPRIA